MNAIRADARPMWITSNVERVDHAVWDHDLGEHITEGQGRFPTVCGAQVVPAALAAPPKPPCPHCMAVLRAQASLRDLPDRMTERRPGLLAALFRRRRPRHRVRAGMSSANSKSAGHSRSPQPLVAETKSVPTVPPQSPAPVPLDPPGTAGPCPRRTSARLGGGNDVRPRPLADVGPQRSAPRWPRPDRRRERCAAPSQRCVATGRDHDASGNAPPRAHHADDCPP